MALLIGKTKAKADRSHYYSCYQCDCGNLFLALPKDVGKRVKSCGCLRAAAAWTKHKVAYTPGQIIPGSFLQVIAEVGRDRQGLCVYDCVCTYKDCKSVKRYSSQVLGRGQKSCGCYARYLTRQRSRRYWTK